MRNPKIKDVHGVLYLNGRIRIGTDFGYAAEIDDPEGKFAPLIRLLDGSNTLEDLVAKVAPKLTDHEVRQAVTLLWEEGYVEDAALEPPDTLSDRELMRYKVNLNFFNAMCKADESKYDYQAKLKATRVVLLGLGGIGSNIALALAELGIGTIIGVDFDRVELHNLNRQVLYSTSTVGELKTDVARQRLHDFNPDIEFTAVNHRIDSLDDVRKLLSSYPCDAVINAADRPTGFIDFWVNEACVELGIPLFSATVAKKFGRVYSVLPGETACYNCRVMNEVAASPGIAEEFEYVQKENFWTPNGALGPACMFHSYFISYEILRHVLKLGPLTTHNKTLEIDFITFEQEFKETVRNPDCPVCGKRG